MRKIFVYLFILILICFSIPIIFTKNKTKEASNENIENTDNIVKLNYSYKEYGEINLLHKETNKIEKIKLDEYLYGVVSAEMPASYNIEALKAQAVVARTYTIYKAVNSKGKHGNGADICDSSTCCQAWISKEDRLKRWNDNNK